MGFLNKFKSKKNKKKESSTPPPPPPPTLKTPTTTSASSRPNKQAQQQQQQQQQEQSKPQQQQRQEQPPKKAEASTPPPKQPPQAQQQQQQQQEEVIDESDYDVDYHPEDGILVDDGISEMDGFSDVYNSIPTKKQPLLPPAAAAAAAVPPSAITTTTPTLPTTTTTNPPPPQTTTTTAPPLPILGTKQPNQILLEDVTRELVKKFIADIWNRGELDLIPEVCSKSIRFNGTAGGLDKVGHEGFARMVATIHAALSDYHCEIHSMVVESNKAFCRLRFTGRHTGNLLGYEPTGHVISWMGATEFTINKQEQKILKVWELGDMKTLEEQLIGNHENSNEATNNNKNIQDNGDC